MEAPAGRHGLTASSSYFPDVFPESLPPVLEPPAGMLVGFPNSTQTPELLTNSQDINSGRKCGKVASKEGTTALKGVLGGGTQ